MIVLGTIVALVCVGAPGWAWVIAILLAVLLERGA